MECYGSIPVNTVSGWWYTYPSEKYEFVSWDDDYSQDMESHKSHVPNHQPGSYEDEHPAIPAIPHMSR